MRRVTVIIPNFNGMAFLDGVLQSMENQTYKEMSVIVVDNGSTDGSAAFISSHYPWVHLIELEENSGFAHAVNVGIKAADSPYVILLNNDTETAPDFVSELVNAITKHKKAFSCQAKMIKYYERTRLDDAGDCYSALGWAFALGKDRDISEYDEERKIFSSCAGAAIYRRKLIRKVGYFDDEHFAYLEDLDIGYRAMIEGYENWYAPKAHVYHVGSGTSGSRYNQFKIRYSSRNNIYMIYKNMPTVQIILNMPFFLIGFGTKLVFFTLKGYGREYAAGIKNGMQICRKEKKVTYRSDHLWQYIKIQGMLWVNMFKRFI